MPEKTRYDFDSLSAAWQTAAGTAGAFWCDLMHDSPMWPIHGQYECRTCGRHYFVPWAGDGIRPAAAKLAAIEPARSLHRGVPSLGSALLPRIILFAILLAPHVHSADATGLTTFDISEISAHISKTPIPQRLGKKPPQAGAADETVCPTSNSTVLVSVAQAVSPARSDYFPASHGRGSDRSRDREGAMFRAVQVFNRTKGSLS
jgi:hypothetical protein